MLSWTQRKISLNPIIGINVRIFDIDRVVNIKPKETDFETVLGDGIFFIFEVDFSRGDQFGLGGQRGDVMVRFGIVGFVG